MIDGSDDDTARPAFVRALHESTVIADRIREAIADEPIELVMLALSDLLQEHLTGLVKLRQEATSIHAIRERPPKSKRGLAR